MTNEIWAVSKQHSFFYTEDLKIRDRISRWSDVKLDARYYNSKGKPIAWQFLIPNKIRKRIAKLSGIVLPKAKGRVRMAKKNNQAGKAIQEVLRARLPKKATATTQ